jgi:hypothetical protein
MTFTLMKSYYQRFYYYFSFMTENPTPSNGDMLTSITVQICPAPISV